MRKQGLKTTHSSIVEQNQNNCRRKNCQQHTCFGANLVTCAAESEMWLEVVEASPNLLVKSVWGRTWIWKLGKFCETGMVTTSEDVGTLTDSCSAAN